MRKLVIVNDNGRTPCVPTFVSSGIYLPNAVSPLPFSNAKSLLGNEYPYAVYDMRAENGVNFNLEAFAIVAGTIERGGMLYLLCSDWEKVENLTDLDSERWNDGKAVATPNFWGYFKALVREYDFECRAALRASVDFPTKISDARSASLQLTDDQQKILQNLPLDPADIHLITAPRGRGKSTLSGRLAETLAQHHQVIITARSKAALPNFWRQIERDKIQFFAPDRLIQAVQNGGNFAHYWLFIDEAASLPLPMLKTLCCAFGKVVMTTTTQNYEGTGRGFELKLPKMLDKPFRHWALSQPLRWNENDPLERFVNELLVFDMGIPPSPPFEKGGLGGILSFYSLLSTAHYKTTPTDLRRLFDGENQRLFDIRENHKLIAGCWAIDEGGLDDDLTQAVWQGVRRPKGSLVAQHLCFQGNLPEACRLRSVRISRIAVQPEIQGNGYGKRLVSEIILQISAENPPLDFVSVSFGMSDELLKFWRACGFHLVQISTQKEASSGLFSAMMIYPISEQGKAFCCEAVEQFGRNQGNHLDFTDWDRQNLWGFAYAQRTFSACEISLKRLCVVEPSLQKWIIQTSQDKQSVAKLRLALQKLLLFSAKSQLFSEL